MKRKHKLLLLVAIVIVVILIVLLLVKGCRNSSDSEILITPQKEATFDLEQEPKKGEVQSINDAERTVNEEIEAVLEEPTVSELVNPEPVIEEVIIPEPEIEEPETTVETENLDSVEIGEPNTEAEGTVQELKAKSYHYQKYTITVTDYGTYASVDYPSIVSNSDVLGFFDYELNKYPQLVEYCNYELNENKAIFTYSDEITAIDYADTFAQEVLLYLKSFVKKSEIIVKTETVEPAEILETNAEYEEIELKEPAIEEPEIEETIISEPVIEDSAIVVQTEIIEPVEIIETTPEPEDNNLSVSFVITPYTYQRIKYADHNPSSRGSFYGIGTGLGISYEINQVFSLGTDLFYEYHSFADFHDYHDLKLNERLRVKVLTFGQKKNITLNLSIGAGADFVFRDDGDFGCYPLVVMSGIDLEYKEKNRLIITGLDCSMTWQKGSRVFHLTPYLGFRRQLERKSGK